MAKFEFLLWLAHWLFQKQTFEFDWDPRNSTKNILKHSVSTDSAQQVFYNKDALVPLGIQTEPLITETRFGALGWTYRVNVYQ